MTIQFDELPEEEQQKILKRQAAVAPSEEEIVQRANALMDALSVRADGAEAVIARLAAAQKEAGDG